MTDKLDEEALDKAAREGYAIRCKTNGPRTLAKYASDDIMAKQLADARVIVTAYLGAIAIEQEALSEVAKSTWERVAADPKLANARRKLSIHEIHLIIKHAQQRPSKVVAWCVDIGKAHQIAVFTEAEANEFRRLGCAVTELYAAPPVLSALEERGS